VPRSTPEQIEFRYDAWEPVLARMAELAEAGNGWLNLYPETDEDDPEPAAGSSVLRGLVGGRGPAVPMGTWVAATPKAPASVGVAHGVKEKVAPRLRAAGVFAPERWQLVQDNARRGLVVRVPADETPEEILAWLMSAIDELCPVTLTGHWLAEVHQG
jgi:hypothetical protein